MTILRVLGVGIGAIAVIMPLLVSYIGRGWIAKYDSPYYSYDMVPDLSGKVALVTGVNTGIGYITARELARKGAYVIGTVRSKDKGYATRSQLLSELGEIKGALDMMVVDLASFRSIRSFAEQLFEKRMKLDILVLNAGIVSMSYAETEDGFESMVRNYMTIYNNKMCFCLQYSKWYLHVFIDEYEKKRFLLPVILFLFSLIRFL